MTDNTQSADIIQRLDWMNLRFAAESQSDATTRRHQTIVDARQEILRLRQPTQSDALREKINDIKEAWDWWQVDTYDRCASVVEDAINAALKESK
jgi:c-di-AMP phosphodiesterase-like protein